ncbi:small, acid-soluble spore protein, alpha/beta type [Lutibacter sp. B2]|nr:small, acid-soluble spore protein, alpha/beta type [Lutibacter sp. B2]
MSEDKSVVEKAKNAFEKLKSEFADESPASALDRIEKGDLTYRQNQGDYVGGKLMADLIQCTEDQIARK